MSSVLSPEAQATVEAAVDAALRLVEFSTHLPRTLTRREMQVTTLILQGLNNKEIGQSLSISHRTVEQHRAQAMKKAGAKNTADLVKVVMEHGLV